MTDKEYQEFEHNAVHRLIELNEEFTAGFKLESYPRWDYNQQTGQLIFSDSGIRKVVADFQAVGTIAHKPGTWLWAWANESILPGLTTSVESVRRFGEQNGIRKLTEESWKAEEDDGWEMAAVTAAVTNAQAAYRCPDEKGFLFVVLTNIRYAE